MESVYCFRVGSEDCFKVGRTKSNPKERKDDVSVGSPQKLTEYRAIETEHASKLEWYIHRALDMKRAENGEFFLVKPSELDDAINDGLAFLHKSLPLLKQVEEFKKTKPNEQMREPSKGDRSLYRALRESRKELFLLEQKILILQSQLEVAIGKNLGLKGIASWKWQEAARFNLIVFKEEHPDLYEKYKKSSATRVFRLLR